MNILTTTHDTAGSVRSRLLPTLCALGLTALLVSGCGGGTADDAETAAEATTEVGGGDAVTIWTDRSELFFEYPPMIAGEEGEPWAIHLTILETFAPVTEGSLVLEFTGPDGEVHTDVSETPARDGVYSPAPVLPAPGMYDLTMIAEGPELTDEIWVGPIQVFASEADLPILPVEDPVGITFLKEQQWPIDFATVEATTGEVGRGFETSGEVIAPPSGIVEVSAPVPGILAFDRNRDAPAEGARVTAGERVLTLSPVGGDDAHAELLARAERLQREVERAERLVAAQAIPARRLEEARHDLEVTLTTLEALGAEPGEGYTLSLRAPISGVVTDRAYRLGERVEAGAHLLTVVDPATFRVRFHVPASRAGDLDEVRGATFSPEGSDVTVAADAVVSVGSVLDPTRRTIPVTVGVSNPEGRLRAGMLVTGHLQVGEPEAGVVVPSEAVRDEDGMLVAYVQISGESFERRAVQIGASDGIHTVIYSGVRRGERVVTRGIYPIRLSSLNTSEISDHGHPH